MNQDAFNISVDVKNLIFYTINFTHNGVREELMSAQIDNSTSRLVVAPVFILRAGEIYELELQYTGLINPTAGGDTGGLFFNTWIDGMNQTRYIIATHMETGIFGTPSVFPCFDDPGFKARFNITLIHPKSMVVLANMLENNLGQDYGNGYNITNFPLTYPMSTYLVAFSMGNFVSKQNTTNDGILLRVWAWQGMDPYLDVAIQSAIECFEALTNYTGIKFPMNKLDHLALPVFPVGGQENWGLIIYEPSQVLLNTNTDTTYLKMYGIGTRCHEMSHQWFGDLVTNEWWSDIILHEGIARYFEAYAPGLTYSNQAKWENDYFVQFFQESAFVYDSGIIYGTPFYPIVGQADSFNDVFTVITYNKGASVLRMLSATLGADSFQKGMQRYLNRYQFGNADHVQYFEVMTEIAGEANLTDWCGNPLDVNELMNNWVTQVHFPSLRVEFDSNYQVYEVFQEPYLPLEYLPTEYIYSWNIPIPVIDVNGNKNLEWLYAENTSCSNNLLKIVYPNIYDFIQIYNYASTSLARVKYDDSSFTQIIKLIQTQPDSLDVATKIRIFYDEWAWVYENNSLGIQPRYDRVLQILDIFMDNKTAGSPLFNALNGEKSFLNFLLQIFMDHNEADLYIKLLTKIFDTFYSVIGVDWNEPTDDWNLSILQQSFLPYAVLFNIGDARQKAMDYFGQIIVACNGVFGNYTQCNPIKPDIRRAVYCGAAFNGNQTIYDELIKFLADAWVDPKATYFGQEIIFLEQGLGCLQDSNLTQIYIRFLVSHQKYDPLTYFNLNLKASTAMLEILQTNPQLILRKSTNGLGDFLNGMTYLWGTENRLNQLFELNTTLSSQMSTYDQKAINNYINIVKENVAKNEISYGSITRWLYDNLTPFGPTPWKIRLPNNTLEAISYELHIQPYFPSSYNFSSWKNFTFDGNVRITLNTLTNISSITLNSHRQIINSIQITDLNNISIPYTNIIRDFDNTMLTIVLSNSLPTNTQFTVTIDYTGLISNQPSFGLYTNYDYLEYNGKKSWIFGTHFEDGPSTRALVPCLDEPGYKATWHVTVDYPSDFVALGNTIEESVQILNDGRTRTTFKQTPKMSSYLLAIAVGDFASLRTISSVNKKLLRIWTWSGMETYAQEALTVLESTVDFMTSYFNYTLPLDKYDVLALPQFVGGTGAMENWGLVIGEYQGILYDSDYSPITEKIHVHELVAHEITHHWFGDLVSPKWWQYIFLNEGFASYWYVDRIAEAYPEQKDYADYARFYNQEHALLVEEAYGGEEPSIVPTEDELGSPPLGLFGNQVYDKAAAILHMLSNTIGNDTFQLALQQYLKNFALNNANDTDLWNTITPFAQNASITDSNGYPIDIIEFMKPYTYQNIFPILKVVTSPDGTSISYQQVPFFGSQNFSNYKWPIPIFSILSYDNYDFNWLNSQSSPQIAKNWDWRVDNYGRKAYARVWYDDAAWWPILQQLKVDHKVFDPTTRAQFLGDNFALVRQNLVPWKRLLDHTLYLKNETNFIPFSMYFSQNSAQYSSQYLAIQETLLFNFKFQPELQLIEKYIKFLIDDGGSDFYRTGHWNTDLINPYFTSTLCYLGQLYCNGRAGELFQTFIQNCQNSVNPGKCNTVPPEYRSFQFCYGLKQNQSYYYIIENLIQTAQNSIEENYFANDINALLNGLSCIDDISSINMYISKALRNEYPAQLFQYIAYNDASGMRLFNFFNSTRLLDVIHSSNFDSFLTSMVFSWSTQDQLNWLQNFDWQDETLTPNQAKSWNSTIQQVIDRRTWLTTNQPQISAWLNENFS